MKKFLEKVRMKKEKVIKKFLEKVRMKKEKVIKNFLGITYKVMRLQIWILSVIFAILYYFAFWDETVSKDLQSIIKEIFDFFVAFIFIRFLSDCINKIKFDKLESRIEILEAEKEAREGNLTAIEKTDKSGGGGA